MIEAYTTVAICEAVATGRYVGSHEKLSSSENNRLRNVGAYLQHRFIQFANVEFALPDFFLEWLSSKQSKPIKHMTAE